MRSATLLYMLVVSIAGVAAATDMSHEESVVRNTYAKLSYAVEVGSITRLTKPAYNNPEVKLEAVALANSMTSAEVRFQLSDIRVGNLADIAQTKYEDLVTKPSGGQGLSISPVGFNYTERGIRALYTETAEASWIKVPALSADWNISVGQMISTMAHDMHVEVKMSRFLSCAVTVAYQGRSENYKALWLFGTDSNGKAVTWPVDTLIGTNGGALDYFQVHKVYPYSLAETHMRNIPAVHDWLTTRVVPSALCVSSGDACCDLTALKCGHSIDELGISLHKELEDLGGSHETN